MTGTELLFKLLGVEDHNQDLPWIIWGAGVRGILALKKLKCLGVRIEGFCDMDESKQGTMIEGLPCYGQQIFNEKPYYILVSPSNSEALYQELRSRFDYVLPSGIIDLLISYPLSNGYDYLPPLGHFYSLYPDVEAIEKKADSIYNINKELKDIDFNLDKQMRILNELITYYNSVPEWKLYGSHDKTQYRYRYGNDAFSPADAIHLHCMLRYIKPKRLIEVGSGWSSAVTLDTNEYYLNHGISITFIEPYADLLRGLCKTTDNISLIESGLQEVPLEFFETLEEGDVLFIDSTHVSKVGSDVNYLFFEILPRLKKGVFVHLHDIFYPYEYPQEWLKKGNVWNELYLLRAFLMNNNSYEIIFFFNMLEKKYKEVMKAKWPIKESIYGGSFWMRKI